MSYFIRKWILATFLIAMPLAMLFAETAMETQRSVVAEANTKTESFDRDPGWEGVNHRNARTREPIVVRQEFGYRPQTHNAGGAAKGEAGGFLTAAGEAAYYAKPIEMCDFERPLTASGKIKLGRGGTHLLLGFFNADSVNEWRTPNSLAIRINGRGEKFFALVEYCTMKWKAGGDTVPFPSTVDPATGRNELMGFPCEKSLDWSLTYDPLASNGMGVVTAKLGGETAECHLELNHRREGAKFNRFGLMNVMKSADGGTDVWIDDVAVNGASVESFDRDPKWEGKRNHETYPTRLVRPWFDFGFGDSNFAGGRNRGELGGQIFRGDCRYSDRMACYGDRVGPLSLNRPLVARGTVVLRRGVSDSTTLFGFYNAEQSMHRNDSQSQSIPASVLGIHIEGPSRDGFRFYPVLRPKAEKSLVPRLETFPLILPDGVSHDWSLEYQPAVGNGINRITVTLDQERQSFEFPSDETFASTKFDRFGIVTSWIDGNSQQVYWDDLTYSVKQD